MKLTLDDVHIPKPCGADWDEMREESKTRRFCAQCQHSVHDLSSMTEAEAAALLASDEDLCIQYDSIGETILFAPEPPSRLSLQLEGAKKLLAAALVVPMLAACEAPAPESTPEVVEPIALTEATPTIAVGAGLEPTMPAPTPKPSCDLEYEGEARSLVERLQRERNRKRCLSEVDAHVPMSTEEHADPLAADDPNHIDTSDAHDALENLEIIQTKRQHIKKGVKRTRGKPVVRRSEHDDYIEW